MADPSAPLLPSFINCTPPRPPPPPSPSPPPPGNDSGHGHGQGDASVPLTSVSTLDRSSLRFSNGHGHGDIPLPPISPTLDHSLRRLETFLGFLGLCPFFLSSSSSLPFPPILLPSSVFLLLGLALPILSSLLASCALSDSTSCQNYRVDSFETCMHISQAAVSAVSIGCMSRSLCKYKIRKFLFMDNRFCGANPRFQKEYITRIQAFFRLAIRWIIPCFIVKITRDVFRLMHLLNGSTWRAVVVFLSSIISWSYQTSIILASCTLFHLVCILQVIHFEDFGKLLEQDMDPMLYLEEHMNLRYNLMKISHRFRMFLLLVFAFVTAMLFVVLFITTAYNGKITFANCGDIAVSSVVQVVGLVICLHGAAKISHKSQGIASLASRWHALVTCSSSNNESTHGTHRVPSTGNLAAFPASLLTMDFSESDFDSVDSGPVQNNAQLAYNMSSYHKREALVLYLLSNPGGITIFGWTVDRGMLHSILVFEMSLILFVLGKTFVLSSDKALVNSIMRLF